MNFLKKFFIKLVFRVYGSRFVAGEHMAHAIIRARQLEEEGFSVVINILGEYSTAEVAISDYKHQYIDLVKYIDEWGLSAHIAVKLTQIGLCIDTDLCRENLSKILDECVKKDIVLEIDREGPEYWGETQIVLDDIEQNLRKYVRVCVQINDEYGKNEVSKKHIDGFSVRVCKGAYPGGVTDTNVLRSRFLRIADFFKNQHPFPDNPHPPIAYATHDLFLLETLSQVYQNKEWVEFQFLSGIENGRARALLAQGYNVRIYLPYGPNWLPYGRRRLRSILSIYARNMRYRIFKK